MSHIVTLDPELVQDVSRSGDPLSALDDLYSSRYCDVQNFERDMMRIHRDYLTLISPVAAELFRRTVRGRSPLGEDFMQGFHARSAHIAAEATRIRISYERQHRAALDLAKML